MEIAEIIKQGLSTQIHFGNKRISYMPYKMEIALSVVERIGRGIVPDFNLTSDDETVYRQLIQYFHADPDFPGDLTKGILLMGPTGTGKTLAMQVMSIYRMIDDTKFIYNGKACRMNFDVTEVNKIITDFLNNAYDGIKIYCTRYVACIDDIGTESGEVKYYGNNLDVIGYILAERYANKRLTFGTTNFKLDYLGDKYGDRIISRMYSLFNFITFKGNDRRK